MKPIDGRKYTGGGQYIGQANNSKEHQRCEREIHFNLYVTRIDAYAELPIKVSINGRSKKFIPDVVVFDQDEQPVVIIEVSDKGPDSDIRKCRLIIKNSRKIKEAFVYSIRDDYWYRIVKEDGKVTTQEGNAYSSLLGIELSV